MGKREDNARQTRTKLLEAADRLIVKNGYEGVSVDSIVKETGIAKGTFYNYFARKEDLIFALSKRRFAHVAQTKVQNISAQASIATYLTDFMTVIVESKIELTRQWVRYVSVSDANQDKWQLDVTSLDQQLQQLIEANRLLSHTPHLALANTLVTQLYGIILSWCMAPGQVDPKVATQLFCDHQLPLILKPYLVNNDR